MKTNERTFSLELSDISKLSESVLSVIKDLYGDSMVESKPTLLSSPEFGPGKFYEPTPKFSIPKPLIRMSYSPTIKEMEDAEKWAEDNP